MAKKNIPGRRIYMWSIAVRNIDFEVRKTRNSLLAEQLLECLGIIDEGRQIRKLRQALANMFHGYSHCWRQYDFVDGRPEGGRNILRSCGIEKNAGKREFFEDVFAHAVFRYGNGVSAAVKIRQNTRNVDFRGRPSEYRDRCSLHPFAIGTDVCACRKQTYASCVRMIIRRFMLSLRSGMLCGTERLRRRTMTAETRA